MQVVYIFILKPFDFIKEKAVASSQVEYFDVTLSVLFRVFKALMSSTERTYKI